MIACNLGYLDRQVPLTPSLKKAIDFLRRPDISALPDGTVEIDGKKVFAIVQRYQTISADIPKFEYHSAYIDIQFIAAGEEVIGWAPAGRMSVDEAYDEGKDIAFGTVSPQDWTPLLLKSGDAAVLRPEDAHAPRLAVAGRPSQVLKVVVKVAV